MEKKQYMIPNTEQVVLNSCTNLMDWSAPKDSGGGGNVPEAKPMVIIPQPDEEETEDETVFSLPRYTVWED